MIVESERQAVGTYRAWVPASWLMDHLSDADMLIAARAVEYGVPEGTKPRRSYSPWRKAYLYTWQWLGEETIDHD